MQSLVFKAHFLKPTFLIIVVCLMISASAQCTGDCQNGKGKMVDADGNTFDGQWKNGKLEGIGTMVMPNGVKYIGEFKESNMHGYGVVYLANGSVAQSGIYDTNKQSSELSENAVLEILNKKQSESASASNKGCTGDCQDGKGVLADADGNIYDGSFKAGKRHGYGILKLAIGAKYIGEFDSDNMQGYGVIYGNDGKYLQSGVYENNALKTSKSETEVKMFLAKYN